MEEVVVEVDILEDATVVEVAVKDWKATVTVCGIEEARPVVTVLLVGVEKLLVVTAVRSISIGWLGGLPGIAGRGKVESTGVENFLRWVVGCIPSWTATVFEKVSVTSF